MKKTTIAENPPMSERFFSAQPITTERARLTDSEAHHLLHVMRAAVGDRVTLFDGSGAEFEAEVAACGRSEVELTVCERRAVDRELPFSLKLGVALPKGDRQRWLVEKLTELGVSTLVPLVTERGVAQPTGGAIERLARAVIEASKQCGRNRLMQIGVAARWEDFVSESAGSPAVRLVAHPGGAALATIVDEPAGEVVAAIGPEGGFTPEEIRLAGEWQAVDLGPRVLRVETAAVCLASALALGARRG